VAKRGVRIAVLAGGRGSRLGGAKPNAELAGRPLIAHVLAAAEQTGLPITVVAKRDTPLPALRVPLLVEPDEPRHPLAGVIAALRSDEQPDAILAVGCDTPFVTAPLLRALASLDGAAALQLGERLQPLPARYPRAALGPLQAALEGAMPLRETLAALRPHVLGEEQVRGFGDPHLLCFNVNDAAGLREAERLLSSAAARPAPRRRPARRG
jgi:molybdenum cofactor guanylyltransferase